MTRWAIIISAFFVLGGCSSVYRSGGANDSSLWGGVSTHVSKATR